MNYVGVYLHNTRDIFTWSISENISVGARVRVALRGRKKVGIVVSVTKTKPKFKTQPVLDVLDLSFVSEQYVQLAQWMAERYFVSLPKIMSLGIPDEFLTKEDPVKREVFYEISKGMTVERFDTIRNDKRKRKQNEILAEITEANGKLSLGELKKFTITTVLKGMVENDVLCRTEGGINSVNHSKDVRPLHTLSETQQNVFEGIKSSEKPVLLWGVTGSGKTEVYKNLIATELAKSSTSQVVLLVPEIALTPQLLAELRGVSGDGLAVWHSNITKTEKVQEFARLQSGEARVLLGTRSAMMVPLKSPSLIIVDEEHEWTYKSEFAPRFWVHEVVEQMRSLYTEKTKLVFGSATPRLESIVKVESGEWHQEELKQRVHQQELPSIQVLDMKNESKRGNHSPLSMQLIEQIDATIKDGKQVVLFLNKRGFAASTQCRACGEVHECRDCTAPMKVHGQGDKARLICHVCGLIDLSKNKCIHCGEKEFALKGWGTQTVEEFIKKQFPQWRVLRADRDTVTGKFDHQKILKQFHDQEADILLGTQMIAKGLDFEKVTLVGVVLADIGLFLPDFRAEERVFQTLLQVAGRAGRRSHVGKIVIQSYQPSHELFGYLKRYDQEGFYEYIKEQRKLTGFPPFKSVGKISFSDVDKMDTYRLAKATYDELKRLYPDKEFSLAPAFFPRTHNKYHWHVFIHAKDDAELLKICRSLTTLGQGKVDVNPTTLL